MNRFTRIWAYIAATVDTLLLIDLATDLWKKYQDRRAKRQNKPISSEEEPAAETAFSRTAFQKTAVP